MGDKRQSYLIRNGMEFETYVKGGGRGQRETEKKKKLMGVVQGCHTFRIKRVASPYLNNKEQTVG